MSQVLSDLAKKDDLLDLVFVNREGLVGVVMLGDCLDCSDQELVDFRVCGVMRKKFSRVATLNFKRANLKLLKELLSSVPWCRIITKGANY